MLIDFSLAIKLLIFTIVQYIPLFIWYKILERKQIEIDWRLVISYFICGSWFGMFGELFLFKFIELVFDARIWEYRTFPIHNGITSWYGPIMWGNAAVYICFHKNYLFKSTAEKKNWLVSFVYESGYLLALELVFNFLAYALFHEYFFYYFVPDLGHWTSLTNLPFWWMGYQIVVKYSKLLHKEEKLNLIIAVMLIMIVLSY